MFEEFDENTFTTKKRVIDGIIYVGYAESIETSLTDEKWLVKRIVPNGEDEDVDYASLEFDQTFDDPPSNFDTPPFSNNVSILMDGVNDRVDVGNFSEYDIDNNEPFSLSAWFKTTSTGTITLFGKQGGSNSVGYRMQHQSSQMRFHLSGGAGSNRIEVRTGTINVNDGNWHHVVFAKGNTTNANDVDIYIDSVLQVVTLNSDNLSNPTNAANPFQIGARNTNSNEWVGNIDDPSFWNIKLNQTQVDAIYGTAKPNDLSQLAFFNNCTGWWRMGDGDTFPIVQDRSNNATPRDGTMIDMSSANFVLDVP